MYKSVNINFSLCLKFIKTLRIIIWESSVRPIWWIYVLYNPQGLFSGTYIFIFALTIKIIALHWCKKRFYVMYFCFYTIFCYLDPQAFTNCVHSYDCAHAHKQRTCAQKFVHDIDSSMSTFTWDLKWTQTSLKSQNALKSCSIYMTILLRPTSKSQIPFKNCSVYMAISL